MSIRKLLFVLLVVFLLSYLQTPQNNEDNQNLTYQFSDSEIRKLYGAPFGNDNSIKVSKALT